MSSKQFFYARSQTPTMTNNYKPQQDQSNKQEFQNFSNSNQQKQIASVYNYFPDQKSVQIQIQNFQQNRAKFQYQSGNFFKIQNVNKPIKANYSFQPNPQNSNKNQFEDLTQQNQSQIKQEKQQDHNHLRTSGIISDENQREIFQDRPKSKSEYAQPNQQNNWQVIPNPNHLTIQNYTQRNNNFQQNYNDSIQININTQTNHQNSFRQQNYALNQNQPFEKQNQSGQKNFQQQQNFQQQCENNQIIEQQNGHQKIKIIARGQSVHVAHEDNQHKDTNNFQQQSVCTMNSINALQDEQQNYIEKKKKLEFVTETQEDVMNTRLQTMKFKCQHCQNYTGEKLISLPCHHYYCQDCFKEYIQQQINQGYIEIFCHCKIKIKFTPIIDAEIYSQYAEKLFNNQLKQIQMKYSKAYYFQECKNCSFFWIQGSLLQTNYIKFCNQQEKAAKYLCSEHQKPLQFIHMRESPKQKLLCKKCESTHKLKLNKASELLLEINQDHPLNYYLKETKKQYENLRKELKHKVDELLDETEDEINNLINHKLSDRLIQRYIFDEKLNEADFEKLHEIICKYYEYEKEGQQVIAKIPANEMGNVYSIQQKCQKIESIIKAFNKPKYYQKLNTQQSQENLGSMPIIIEPTNKKQEIKKKDENKKKGLFSYHSEIILNSVCHCIQLNKTQNILICGLQENENEENLIVLQKQNEKYHQIQNLVGHEGSVYAIQLDADGDHLFSAGEDKTIRIWKQNVLSKQLNEKQYNSIQIIQNAHQSEIHCLTLNKENNLLASGCKDGLIKIWVEIEKEWINSQTLQQHQNWVKSLSFNLETSLLASGSGDKSIIIWQLNDEWELFQIIKDHTNFVNCVCFGSINNSFVSGSEDQTIKIWEQQKDKTYICIQQLEGGHYVRSVCFNFNQLLLITGSYSTIKVWTKNHSGKFVLNQEKFYDSRQVMISEDGKSIFSVNRFSFNIRVFKIKEKKLQK